MNMNGDMSTDRDGQLLRIGNLYRCVVKQVTDLVIVMNRAGQLVHSVSHHPKLAVSELMADFYDRIHPDYLVSVHRTFLHVTNSRITDSLTLQFQVSGEEWIWAELTCMMHEVEGIDHLIVSMKDITQRKQDEEALRRLAFHDPLTGLPNRRLFEVHVNQAIAQAKRIGQLVALFYMDVDDFKLVNDRMGHDAGDLFLVSFAMRIKGCIREIDTFARMGGDEFTLLLPNVDSKENVEKVAQRIMEAVNKSWEIAGTQFQSSISLGIAIYPSDGEKVDVLLRNVDQALYEVKSRGRNGYRFYYPK